MRTPLFLLTMVLLAATGVPVAAQNDPAADLASRSAIIVLGTVTQVAASDEPLLAPSPATVVIRIDRMLAGSELAGDQTGRSATVILSQLSQPGALKVGSQALFFGNPRFLGKTITVADLGELPAPAARAERASPALEEGLQARRDAPLRARLSSAEKVFRGKVETVRPLIEAKAEAEAPGRKARPRDEHDPDWQVARVRVTSAVRGTEKGAVVSVVFAASRDIVWFHAPKLRAGDAVLILGQRPEEEKDLRATGGLKFAQEHQAVLVTHPLDVLPVTDEKRVKALLPSQEVPR